MTAYRRGGIAFHSCTYDRGFSQSILQQGNRLTPTLDRECSLHLNTVVSTHLLTANMTNTHAECRPGLLYLPGQVLAFGCACAQLRSPETSPLTMSMTNESVNMSFSCAPGTARSPLRMARRVARSRVTATRHTCARAEVRLAAEGRVAISGKSWRINPSWAVTYRGNGGVNWMGCGAGGRLCCPPAVSKRLTSQQRPFLTVVHTRRLCRHRQRVLTTCSGPAMPKAAMVQTTLPT